MGTKSAIFHSIILAHHIFSLKYSDDLDFSKCTDQRIIEMKNFGTKYFTTWNMVIQLTYFIIALNHDLAELIGIPKNLIIKLKEIKGYIFTILFPSTIFVSGFFWGFYSIDREWVLPQVADSFIPNWLNHMLHTNISIFLIIETIISKQVLPTFKTSFLSLTFINIFYDAVIFYTYYQSGRWIYGIFYVLNWNQRIGLLVLNYLATIAFLKVGIVLHQYRNIGMRSKKIEWLK